MQANQLLCRNITSALCSFEYRRKHGWLLTLNVAFWTLPFADAQQDAVGSAFSRGHVTRDVCDPIPTGLCKASSPAYSTAPFLGKPLSTAGLRGAHWDCSHTAAFQPVCSASPSPPREPPRAGMGFSCHLSHSFSLLSSLSNRPDLPLGHSHLLLTSGSVWFSPSSDKPTHPLVGNDLF